LAAELSVTCGKETGSGLGISVFDISRPDPVRMTLSVQAPDIKVPEHDLSYQYVCHQRSTDRPETAILILVLLRVWGQA